MRSPLKGTKMKEYETVPRSEEGRNEEGSHDDEAAGIFRPKITTPPPRRRLNQCILLILFLSLVSAGIIGLFIRLSKVWLVPTAACTTSSAGGSGATHHSPSKRNTVTYDASAVSRASNPFNLTELSSSFLLGPGPSFSGNAAASLDPTATGGLGGYILQPDVQGGAVAFVADGDLFFAQLSNEDRPISAIRLTVTVGNVRTPKINPAFPYILAFTATYQARREVYIMDLRRTGRTGGNIPVQRLTYFDSAYGVSSLASWTPDGKSLFFAAQSNQVSLRDTRLYEISIRHDAETPLQVLQIQPVPLAQATEGVKSYDDDYCIYFVRYKQSSWTARYVGGTAESLWAYCEGETTAVGLSTDYSGTTTSPRVLKLQDGRQYLLVISDRSRSGDGQVGQPVFASGDWRATTRNLWAVPLPTRQQLYGGGLPETDHWIQLTEISCQFGGLHLREFAVDSTTNDLVLRIGADLYRIEAQRLAATLTAGGKPTKPMAIPVQILSDFHEQQERLVQLDVSQHLTTVDAFSTDFDTTHTLLTLRGQLWVAPVLDYNLDDAKVYHGSGQNMPPRRYRVIPGAMTGGAIRVLAARHVPLYVAASDTNKDESRRLALVLATDPRSDTAEHAFYLVEVHASSTNQFAELEHFPAPFLGGHVDGGSVAEGGLGSVDPDSVSVSPCGRRFAWVDMDDRICVMSTPIYASQFSPEGTERSYQCLPPTNDQGEPLSGTISSLAWSPGGRYLGVSHRAFNQFHVLSITDCGETMEKDGKVLDIRLGSITQVTPSRFNSYGMYWGKSSFDLYLKKTLSSLTSSVVTKDAATTLYFLSDRDVVSDVTSPWGSRAPMPHFPRNEGYVHALPLPFAVNITDEIPVEVLSRTFSGGGTKEVFAGDIDRIKKESSVQVEEPDARRHLSRRLVTSVQHSLRGRPANQHEVESVTRLLQELADTDPDVSLPDSSFPEDNEIVVDPNKVTELMHRAYRVSRISKGMYEEISAQSPDDGSLAIAVKDDSGSSFTLKLFKPSPFPADTFTDSELPDLTAIVTSTDRKFLTLVSSSKTVVVTETSSAALSKACSSTADWKSNTVETKPIALSIWPTLEYKQMYSDAWRMLRDYFYDPGMHQVPWREVHDRYLPLVSRCWKREELDDVMGQMAAELSALHVFVYGGEYNGPDDPPLAPASLGATFVREVEWKGYKIIDIPERDPDFDIVDGISVYSPLSDQSLRLTGQRGLSVGDVVVRINGEKVIHSPDIGMMLRGMAGQSIRLGVLRQPNKDTPIEEDTVIAVPISSAAASALRYKAWEWSTNSLAMEFAEKAGIDIGYVHIQAMDRNGEDAFTRGFFPSFDKDGLIIDVRHNTGGNIASWILSSLQRKAWMYWAGRLDRRYGYLDWTQQYAFRGKIVVLVDEHTSSNGEGLARGISELGLGITIGTRTWGGGIWGSSANKLVDGGIAAAPQWGTFNKKLGWGGGIEATGLTPDIVVDNDPRLTFSGRDAQLERAIAELKRLLKEDPIPPFEVPPARPDMSLHGEQCAGGNS